jgi:hypothetical protein
MPFPRFGIANKHYHATNITMRHSIEYEHTQFVRHAAPTRSHHKYAISIFHHFDYIDGLIDDFDDAFFASIINTGRLGTAAGA